MNNSSAPLVTMVCSIIIIVPLISLSAIHWIFLSTNEHVNNVPWGYVKERVNVEVIVLSSDKLPSIVNLPDSSHSPTFSASNIGGTLGSAVQFFIRPAAIASSVNLGLIRVSSSVGIPATSSDLTSFNPIYSPSNSLFSHLKLACKVLPSSTFTSSWSMHSISVVSSSAPSRVSKFTINTIE